MPPKLLPTAADAIMPLTVDVSIVIVSYNVCDLLRACLRSVYAGQGVGLHVCVVDNNSSDGSAAMVREEFPQATVIESSVNGGFSYANNLGLRALGFSKGIGSTSTAQRPRYVLLLNPDTLLPPDAVARMVAFMDADPSIGVAGPRLVRQDGSLDLACRRSFPSPGVSLFRMTGLSKVFPRSRFVARYNLTFLDDDAVAEVDTVAGSFMMVRSEAVAQVGLLDESFFMYGEDIDWAFRIKQGGWRVMYNGEVSVLHYKGQSSRKNSYKATREFHRSMLIFYRKHYARRTFFLLGWLIVGAIYVRGATIYLTNLLRPTEMKRVS